MQPVRDLVTDGRPVPGYDPRITSQAANPLRKCQEFDMPTNVGSIDRVLRIIVGLVLISLVFIGPQTPWGWIGIVPLLTAFIGYCPAYSLVGMNTCAKK